MFPSDSDLTSLFQTLQCNTYHFEMGKNAKLCFPFICESLERVGVRAEWSHSLLLRPCGSPGSLHQALRPSEDTRSPARHCEASFRDAVPPH